MANKTIFGEEAKAELKKGIDLVHRAVSCTLGAKGKNAVYQKYGSPTITNDGVSIARKIEPKDNFEYMGADLIRQAAEKTNDEAGDGTTTSTILAHALITHGEKALSDKKVGAVPLKQQIDKAVEEVIEKLKATCTPIETDEELLQVAKISVEDDKIAEIVTDAVKKSGKNGIVMVEESSGLTIEREDIEGIRFQEGYFSPYMVTNPDKMEAIHEDIHILITDKTISTANDIFPLLEEMAQKNYKKLLIIADDVQGEALAMLVANKMKGIFYSVAVKRPYDKDLMEDIAIATGATVVTSEKGIAKFDFSHLGFAKKIVTTKDHTTIMNGLGDTAQRIKDLEELVKDADEYQKPKIQERLAKLSNGIVMLRVGASTETEMKYLKLKVDDAVNAVKAATEEGIVAGGGVALYTIAQSIEPKNLGEEVVKAAIEEPLLQIMRNCGEEGDMLLEKITGGAGYNAKTGKIETDMIKAGIIDPVKVTRCALKNAASLAGVFITTDVAIAEIPDKE